MNRRPADQQARLEALDPGRSFIVQAPAGSGKTGLLTQRFLVLLAGVDNPEEILAITFTRKAAAEMRDRILEALRQAASGEAPEEAYERQTFELARKALARDRERGWRLLENPARLRVRTIDAFCQYLAGQAPLLSGLGGGAGVAEDARPLYEAAARHTLEELESEEAGEALALLLEARDNDTGRLAALLAEMLARRDQWLRHLHDHNTRGVLEEALSVAVEQGLAEARQALAFRETELVPLVRFAADNLDADEPLAACRDLEALPPPTADRLPCWRALADLLLTKDGNWRKGVNKNQGFPAGCDEKEPMKALLETLSAHPEAAAALHNLRSLPDPVYRDTEWRVIGALFQVLRHAAAHLQLVFGEAGQVDFSETMLRALQALGPPEEPTDLALRLDYRIQHLLVDEFQDTSRSQYELLERLTAGWQPGDGRTLFLVGDPMQSIYRFREAEVGLFLEVWRHGLGDLSPVPLRLEVNFRSQRNIVEWVNDHFPRVLPERDDLFTGAVRFTPSAAFHGALPGEAVTVHPRLGRDDRAEAQQVVEIVREHLAETDGDLAILVRSRAHAAAIAPALKEANIPFQAVEMEGLAGRPLVQDLLALTLALLYPADRTHWLALLRGPLCGLTLADLHALAAGDQRTLPELMEDEARLATLSEEGRRRLARVRPLLRAALGEGERKRLRTRVEGLWLALGGPAAADHTALEEATLFFELLRDLEEAGAPLTRERLLAGIEGLHALPREENARVHLMTMHKAKGLEFDTVVLPGLGRGSGRNDPPLLRWLETVDEAGNERLVLAPMRPAWEKKEGPAAAYIRELEKRKEAHEEARLLYVAATRARRRLHLLGHAEPDASGDVGPAKGSLLAHLWPALGHHWEGLEAPEEEPPAETGRHPAGLRLLRPAPGWQPPGPPADVPLPSRVEEEEPSRDIEFDWAGDLARVVGVVAHRLLQHLALHGDPGAGFEPLRGHARTLLRREGLDGEPLEEALALVATAVGNTLASERGRWILDRNHREARCELPLTALLDGRPRHLVVDRTFVDAEGTRWIIDYKTGRHEGGDPEAFLDQEKERYRTQLEAYAAAFRLLEPERPLRVALYHPMLDGWREWEPG